MSDALRLSTPSHALMNPWSGQAVWTNAPAATTGAAPAGQAPKIAGDSLQLSGGQGAAGKPPLSAEMRKTAGPLVNDPYYSSFQNLDGNQDGWLSGTEKTAATKDWPNEADLNGDGALSPQEFLDGQHEKQFRSADKDGDGKIAGDEQNRLMKPWREATDANRDGAVDRTEYRAYRHGIREVGYNGDANKDGFLTGAEIRPTAQAYAQTDAQGRSMLTRESYVQQKVQQLRNQPRHNPGFW